MYIESIELNNFTGIFNGLNRTNLKIDFTDNPNRIILISGNNGSGKSTLLNSLHPFSGMYDTCNNEFDIILEGKDGYKQIIIQDDDKRRYKIQHRYLRNNKTKSYTVKSYIAEYDYEDNTWVELNERGIQGTFLDIVWDRLHCDQNILQISKMGTNVNSFITKKSTERKQYISQLLPNIEDYLNYYKVVSKKITLYNNDLKVIASQLEKYGRAELVENELNTQIRLFNNLDREVKKLKTQRDELNGKLQILDMNGTKALVEDYIKQYKEIHIDGSIVESDVYKKYYSDDIDELMAIKEEISKKETECETILKGINDKRAIISKELNENKSSLDESFSEATLKQLNDQLNVYMNEKDKLESYEAINNPLMELVDNYDSSLKLKYFLLNRINPLFDQYDVSIRSLNELYEFKKNNGSFIDQLNILNGRIDKVKEYEKRLNDLEKYNQFFKMLDQRPSNCVTDKCPFIIQAVQFEDKKYEYEWLKEQIDETKLDDKANEKLEWLNKWVSLTGELNKLIESEYPDNEAFMAIIDQCFILEKRNTIMNEYVPDMVDFFIRENKLNTLNKDIEVIKSKIKTLNERKKSLDKVIKRVESLENELKDIDKEYTINKKEYTYYYVVNSSLIGLIDYNKQINKKRSLKELIEQNKEKYKEIVKYEDEINELNESIEYKEDELKGINDTISSLKVRIGLIEETENRKKLIEEEYNDIKVLKEALSPTKGIPLMYIGSFLEDIKHIANDMLKDVYDGNYKLWNFVLNEDEFSIEIRKGNDNIIPDIRRCSSGEIMITGVAILFSLIEKSLSKYNIITLDEADGPLDSQNKQLFVSILNKQLNHLNIDQCFIISHNDFFNDGSIPISVIEFPGFALHSDKNYSIASLY